MPIAVLDDDGTGGTGAPPVLNPGGGMPMAFLPVKYATAVTVPFAMIKRGVADLAVSADWTPATGDAKISLDGGVDANVGTLPSAPASTAGKWAQPLTTGETTGKFIHVSYIDAATKAVEDNSLLLFTYGHASAYWPFDLSQALPTNFSAFSLTAGGLVTLAGVTHTSAVIPLVTDVTTKTGYSLANPAGMKKNAALPGVMFEMRDSTTGLLKPGLTITATRSIDGAAFASCANSATEISSTGIYKIDVAAADVNGDSIMFNFVSAGALGTTLYVLTEP